MDYTLLIAGFVGGVIRGIVGFIKHQNSYKNVPFKLGYFLLIMALSGIVGLSAGWVANGFVAGTDPSTEVTAFFAFIAGYAGGDFIENVFKIISKQPSLYKIPKVGSKK